MSGAGRPALLPLPAPGPSRPLCSQPPPSTAPRRPPCRALWPPVHPLPLLKQPPRHLCRVIYPPARRASSGGRAPTPLAPLRLCHLARTQPQHLLPLVPLPSVSTNAVCTTRPFFLHGGTRRRAWARLCPFLGSAAWTLWSGCGAATLSSMPLPHLQVAAACHYTYLPDEAFFTQPLALSDCSHASPAPLPLSLLLFLFVLRGEAPHTTLDFLCKASVFLCFLAQTGDRMLYRGMQTQTCSASEHAALPISITMA